MKTTFKKMILAFGSMILIANLSFALGSGKRVIEKATELIENGAPDDWKLFADQAAYLLEKNVGLDLVKTWLEKSLDIKEDAYNLEVMGDYYAKCQLPNQAVSYYIKSIDTKKAQKEDPNLNTTEIQKKIVSVRQK